MHGPDKRQRCERFRLLPSCLLRLCLREIAGWLLAQALCVIQPRILTYCNDGSEWKLADLSSHVVTGRNEALLGIPGSLKIFEVTVGSARDYMLVIFVRSEDNKSARRIILPLKSRK